ncbi:ricin B-like lectin [Phlegmacium glaucopus]|nr:ricin B-like lectin [Phlegmacium glaucopus]
MMKMFHATLLSLIVTSIAFASAQVWQGPIKSAASSKCLDVRGSEFKNGTSDCDGSAAQTWLISEGLMDVRLVDPELSAKFCLDAITNVDTSNKVVIWECNKKQQQQWKFTNGDFIILAGTNICFDVLNSSTSNGDNQVWNAAELQNRDVPDC